MTGGVQAYAGKVRNDIDHEQLKPAAWRVDDYLEGDDEADYDIAAITRAGPFLFSKVPEKNDDMARREQVDDYSVSMHLLFAAAVPCQAVAWSSQSAASARYWAHNILCM